MNTIEHIIHFAGEPAREPTREPLHVQLPCSLHDRRYIVVDGGTYRVESAETHIDTRAASMRVVMIVGSAGLTADDIAQLFG